MWLDLVIGFVGERGVRPTSLGKKHSDLSRQTVRCGRLNRTSTYEKAKRVLEHTPKLSIAGAMRSNGPGSAGHQPIYADAIRLAQIPFNVSQIITVTVIVTVVDTHSSLMTIRSLKEMMKG